MGVQDPSACGVPPAEDQEEGFEHKPESVSTEDVLTGAPSLDEEEMMEPRRPMRLEHRGDKENRAILEALRMDEEERSDY